MSSMDFFTGCLERRETRGCQDDATLIRAAPWRSPSPLSATMHLELATGLATPAHEDNADVDHTDQMLAMWRQKNALRGGGTDPSRHTSSTPSALSRVISSAPELSPVKAGGTTFTRLAQNEKGNVAVQCRVMGLGVHETCEAVTRAVRREHTPLSPSESITGGDDHPYFYPTVDDYLDSYLATPSTSASFDVGSVSSVSTNSEDYLYSTSSSSYSTSSSDATELLREDGRPAYKEQRQDIISGPATPPPARTLDLGNADIAEHHIAEIAEYFHKGYQMADGTPMMAPSTPPANSPANDGHVLTTMATWFSEPMCADGRAVWGGAGGHRRGFQDRRGFRWQAEC
jgi:hypothetical protein